MEQNFFKRSRANDKKKKEEMLNISDLKKYKSKPN
jgi:hypothetical protein